MKILMLSTDANIFREGSEVRQRMIEYGSLFEELHIVVFTRRKSQILPRSPEATGIPAKGLGTNPKSQINPKIQISKNVWAYATNTSFATLYFKDAYKIGKSIIATPYTLHPTPWVVSAQDPFETGLVGYLLKRKLNLPLQIQIHTDFLSPYFWRESLKNKIRVLLGKWLVKRADQVRVVSERIKDSLMAMNLALSHGVVVLPIFVDAEKFRNAPIKTDLHKKYPGYDFIILMASRLTKEKNIEMAIEAFVSVKCQVSSVKNPLLLIIGDGPEAEELKLHAKRYTLNANIIFEPWTDDLVSYYKTADLFLNTSNYEGYGRTIIEALAAGCPVVSTDVGIVSEFIKPGQSGMIIEQKDARALSDALMEIISNKGKYKGVIEQPLIKDKNEYLKLYKENLLKCTITGNFLKKN